MKEVDNPERIHDLRRLVQKKHALNKFYLDAYQRYVNCLSRCPKGGLAVEIGSGASFAKEFIPDLITTDIIPYDGLDKVLDGTRMPFEDGEVKFFALLNVFHHIPDVEKFLFEAQRCLCSGGRMLIVDQHVGWLSQFLFKYLHSENFDTSTTQWQFRSTGPLSAANGALTWIVFQRDQHLFEKKFLKLRIHGYKPHTPLFYWLSGGLKSWTLVPKKGVRFAQWLDSNLLKMSVDSACFVDVELVKE